MFLVFPPFFHPQVFTVTFLENTEDPSQVWRICLGEAAADTEEQDK